MTASSGRTYGAPAACTAAVLLLILATVPVSLAQSLDWVTDGWAFEVRYTATFSEEELTFGEQMGYDTVSLPDGDYLTEPGQPRLPVRIVGIALPAGMAATSVRVVGTQSVELPGQYTIFPAQPPRPVGDSSTQDDFVPADQRTYSSTSAYPGELASFTHQADLAGQAVAFLRVCPLQYVPAEGKLRLHTEINLVLDGVQGYTCGDYLPGRVSDSGRATYEQMVRGMVVNPDDVELREAVNPPPQTTGVGPGDYDYVLITPQSYVASFQPLVDWKTKKGVPATIVTTDWIYNSGGYTGTNQNKIRAFCQDANANWGTTFFLLGGDTNLIPYYSRTFSIAPESVPNDTYYADYDGDWICEVHVGRAAVRGAADIPGFISKVLTYEKSPPLSTYAKTAAFFGFDLAAHGSGEGENMKKDMKNLYIPASWTFRSEYDSYSGTHKAHVIAYLNQGNNLVNHADHSSTDSMGTGYTNHGESLFISDVNALYNGSRQSILYSLGCWACDYPADCIAEAFVRNPAGGAVAFVGNSRYGWYMQYTSDGYSARYDRYFFRSLFTQGYTTLGPCFSDHKNDAYQNDTYYQYIFTELTLLGDPELPILTEDPQSLSVMHPDSVKVGEATVVTVQVLAAGNPLGGATVCLWKPGDVYQVSQTNASGVANILVNPATTGTMWVTVTKRNYLPYEGSLEVVEESVLVGDVNCDGAVNFGDINPFVLALTDPLTYVITYPNCPLANRDINGDGVCNFADINPFVLLLSGG
jgi:hypothetical protein